MMSEMTKKNAKKIKTISCAGFLKLIFVVFALCGFPFIADSRSEPFEKVTFGEIYEKINFLK